MQIRSNIPAGSVCCVGVPIRFEGYVDDFAHGISAVEFSLDDGAHWTAYPTTGAVADKGVSWRFDYTPASVGDYVLKARAVDGDGAPSPVATRFVFQALNPDAYVAFASSVQSEPQNGSQNEPSASARPELNLYGSFRLRAVGGGSLEGARLFRSAELEGLSVEDARFITSYLGIRSIYDIRSQWEVALHAEPCLAGAKSVAFEPSETRRRKDAGNRLVAGVIGEYGAPEERMRKNYRRYVRDYPIIGATLRAMASESVPALVHCVNGKDRTGVLCAVLMRAAGAHPDDVMTDYLMTNEVNATSIQREFEVLGSGMTEYEEEILRSFLEARPSYLDAFFTEAECIYGSFEGYLNEGLRLTSDHVERLSWLLQG